MSQSATWNHTDQPSVARASLATAVQDILLRLFEASRYGRVLKEHLDDAIAALGESTEDYVAAEMERQAQVESGADTLARLAAIRLSRRPLIELSADADRQVRELLREAVEEAVHNHREDLRRISTWELCTEEQKHITPIFYEVLTKQLACTEAIISKMLEDNAQAAIKVMQRLQEGLLQQDLKSLD